MQHLDEGTIHAWLDGALPPDEASRVEAHSATCAGCAALVAEARGLIAASSRILSTLDDVPGDVLPGKTQERVVSVDSLRRQQAPTSRRARRSWYARPQFAAAAALVFVAVGTILVTRGARRSPLSEMAAPTVDIDSSKLPAKPGRAMEPAVTTLSGQRQRGSVDTNINTPMRVNAAEARESASQSPPAARRFAADAAAADAPRSRAAATAGVGAAGSTQATRQAEKRRDAATPPASPAPTPPAARNEVAAAKAAVDSLADRRADTTLARGARRSALSADEILKQERIRLSGEAKVASGIVATTSAIARAPSATADRMRKTLTADDPRIATSAGCYRLTHTPEVQADSLPNSLRIVPERVERVEGRLAWRVTENDESATSLSAWRWTVDDDGRVTLLRQAGTGWQRYPFVTDPALVAGRAVLATRVDCVRR